MQTDACCKIIKNCPNCQNSFECFCNDCWCDKLPNIMPLTEAQDCVCSACLETAIDEKGKAKK